MPSTRRRPLPPATSAFSGFRSPAEVIVVAVRWYLRYNLVPYRDVEELLHERGIEVDHVTVCRWVQRLTPLLIDAARFIRAPPGTRTPNPRIKSGEVPISAYVLRHHSVPFSVAL